MGVGQHERGGLGSGQNLIHIYHDVDGEHLVDNCAENGLAQTRHGADTALVNCVIKVISRA